MSVFEVILLGLLAVAIAYIVYIHRTPGLQPGEAALQSLKRKFSEHVSAEVEAAKQEIAAAKPDPGAYTVTETTTTIVPNEGAVVPNKGADLLAELDAEIARNAEEAVRLDTKRAKVKEAQERLAAALAS